MYEVNASTVDAGILHQVALVVVDTSTAVSGQMGVVVADALEAPFCVFTFTTAETDVVETFVFVDTFSNSVLFIARFAFTFVTTGSVNTLAFAAQFGHNCALVDVNAREAFVVDIEPG